MPLTRRLARPKERSRIDWDSFPIKKGTPSVLDRHRRRTADDAALRSAYAVVDARDQGVCQISGAFTTPGAVDPRQRREHHHLAGRRVQPSWVTDPKRIVTVSAFVHQLLTCHALELEGTDATKRLIPSWNRNVVKPGEEPFRLKSKRWSANE